MTLDPRVMRAILAMDSYNRGYGPGLSGITGNALGDAVEIMNSSVLRDAQNNRLDIPAGFYAVAYRMSDGEIVISYRGTDNPSVWSNGDILNGWLQGGGTFTSQSALAVQFYQLVAIRNFRAQIGARRTSLRPVIPS